MLYSTQTGSRMSTGRIALQGLAILLIFLVALFALKFTVLDQLAVSKSIYLELTSDWQTDPDVLAKLALVEQGSGDLEHAHQLYIRALDSFVLHSPSWLGMVEVLKDSGNKSRAVDALQVVDSIHIDDIELLWRKAQLARKLKQDKILLATLQQLVQNNRAHRSRAINIAGGYWSEVQFLLQNFDTACYPEILGYFIRHNRLDHARTVWQAVKNKGALDPETTVAYVSFLLDNRQFNLAAAEWRDTFQKNGFLLYNGNFEEPIVNKAFGWQTRETKGVTLQYDDFGGGLTISFDGTENAAFILSQVIPLFPGDHVFRGSFETTSITSQQRPYFLISGYNCQGLYIKDTMLPPSEYKTEFAIPFSVPGSCKAVKIDLIRNRANDFDSLISGSITLHNLEINRLSPPPDIRPSPEEKVTDKETAPVGIKVDGSIALPGNGRLADPDVHSRVMPEEKNETEPVGVVEKKTKIVINRLIIRP